MYIKLILTFLAGFLLAFALGALNQTSFGRREREAYEVINNAIEMKLKGELSYKQFCSDEGFQQIEEHWPSGANSFYVIIEDNFLGGGYAGIVFFDTGDAFYIETSKCGGKKDKVVLFEKREWQAG